MKHCKATRFAVIFSLFLVIALSGCGDATPQEANDLEIICAGFPEYDWTRNILGDNPSNIALELIVDSGTDMHSYQATVDDIARISRCDLLIYTGGVSEQWITDAVESGRDESHPVLELLHLEGMKLLTLENDTTHQHTDDHAHEHEAEHDHAHGEIDEHLWLSLRNAGVSCQAIADELCRIDPDHADLYKSNLASYLNQLNELDASFTSAIEAATLKTILVADRFPFRYLTADYGLDCYAAFSGCSSETDASFETIIFLAEKLDELNLPAVITTEGSTDSIADAVIQNSSAPDTKTLTLDSMQSVTRTQMDAGENYISIMQRNLDTLAQALNPAQ